MWTFLLGKKTYLVALATVAYAAFGWYLGNLTQDAAMAMIFGGAGLGALRHGVTSTSMGVYLIALSGALALTACGTTAPTDVFALRSGYDAVFLAPAANYAALPRCPTADKVCSDAGIVTTLQKADAAAKATLDAAEDTVLNHPTLDASAAIAAATNAVRAAEAIVAVYGVR